MKGEASPGPATSDEARSSRIVRASVSSAIRDAAAPAGAAAVGMRVAQQAPEAPVHVVALDVHARPQARAPPSPSAGRRRRRATPLRRADRPAASRSTRPAAAAGSPTCRGATKRTSTSGAKPPHRPSTTRRSTSSATSRPDRGQPRRAHDRAEHLRHLRAVHVELDDELPVLAEHAVPRPVEPVHVALQAVAQRDARDREPAARVVRAAAASSSRSSSSTAGRFVATTAASSAAPCAGPDVGRYALSSATRRVGMCRRVWRTISSASSTGSSPRCSDLLMLPDAARQAHIRRPTTVGWRSVRGGDDEQHDRVDREQRESEHPEAAAAEHLRAAAPRSRRARTTGSVPYRSRPLCHTPCTAEWGAAPRESSSRRLYDACPPLRGFDRVSKQHRNSRRADATHPGRDPARDFLARLVDVGEQLAGPRSARPRLRPRHPGRMCSGWRIPGTPAAATTMSARCV